MPTLDSTYYADMIRWYIANPPETRRDLLYFATAIGNGFAPVRESVCRHHSTPFDMICSVWFEESERVVAIAARNSYKTLETGRLNAMEVSAKYGLSMVHLGAIEGQAVKGIKYTREFLSHEGFKGWVPKNIRGLIETQAGSSLEMTTATTAGVSSGHYNRIRVDEFEQISSSVLEDLKFMRTSGQGHKGVILWTSSLNRSDGNAARAMRDVAPKGWKSKDAWVRPRASKQAKLHIWCYKDVSEPCPPERRGTKREKYSLEDIYAPGEEITVEAYEGCKTCPLLPSCRGDLARAKGYIPIEDSIVDFTSASITNWLSHKECIDVAEAGTLFFHEFSRKRNVTEEADYNPRKPVYMVFDFGGGTEPTAVGFYQVNADLALITKFAEFVSLARTVEEDHAVLHTMIATYGIRRVHRAWGDDTAGQAMIEWNSHLAQDGIRILPVKKGRKLAMISALGALISPTGGGEVRFLYHPRCKISIKEAKSYRRIIGREDPKDGDDNCVDGDCYMAWVTGPAARKHGMMPLLANAGRARWRGPDEKLATEGMEPEQIKPEEVEVYEDFRRKELRDIFSGMDDEDEDDF